MNSNKEKEKKLRAEIAEVKKLIERKKEKFRENTLRLKMLNDTIEPSVSQLKRRIVKLDFLKMTDDEFLDECENLNGLLAIYQEEISRGLNNG